MEESLLYYFYRDEISNFLLIMRPNSKKLVYVSMGDEEKGLIDSAHEDFDRLSKKTHIKYNLRRLDKIEEDQDFARICSDFRAILESGDELECKEYEFLFGTPFQRKVWKELSRVPFGGTITYGELASNIQLPNTIRAVGTAVGQNKLCVVIPCHRCLPSDGKIGKFRWGSELKQKLLLHEKMIKRKGSTSSMQ